MLRLCSSHNLIGSVTTSSSSMSSPDAMFTPSSSCHATTDLIFPEGLKSALQWIPHSMPISSAMDSNPPIHNDLVLTSSPRSRNTGLPLTVSSSADPLYLPPNAAILSQTNLCYHPFSDNAGSLVNSSLVPSTPIARPDAQSSVPSSPNYDLKNLPSTRPRTSTQFFASTSDLAAHYGIPTTLPPLPIIQSTRSNSVTQPFSHSAAVSEFNTLKASYLHMLSQKTEPMSAPSSDGMSNITMSPTNLSQALADDFPGLLRTIGNFPLYLPSNGSHASLSAQGAPASSDLSPFELDEYLTSPWTPSLDQFGDSPGETPWSDFLSTPLISDLDALTSNDMYPESPLFPSFGDGFESSKAQDSSLDTSNLMTFPASPETPALDPSRLISPSLPTDKLLPSAGKSLANKNTLEPNLSRCRSSATGTRKNITAESLVPLEAPTQPRKYVTPSVTSRKEVPAVFARKRARQHLADGEEDEFNEPLKPNATETEQIEWKRRQNTLAARKSRRRKLVHQRALELQVNELTEDRERWRQRALALQGILQANGISFAEFQD